MENHAARQDTRIRTRILVGRGLGMVWAAALLAGALPIAEVTSSALAQAPATTRLAGDVSSDDAGVFLVDGVHIAVADTAIATETSLGGYTLDVPSGPHTLEISGTCVQPDSIAVDAEGATQFFPLTVTGFVPMDPAVHYRCDSFRATSAARFSSPLHHRAAVSPTHVATISLTSPVTFDGRAYRKLYVTANGWLSFKPVALSKLPSCDRLAPGNAPANALFAYAGCATTKSVTYDVGGGALVVRWHLVDPITAEPTDVEVNFGPPLTVQSNVIEVAYGSLGDAGHDGRSAFVGLTTASGAAFPIGVRQAALRPFHAIQLTPTPTFHF